VAPDLGIERVVLNSDGTTRQLNDKEKDFFKNVVLAEGSLRTVIHNADGTTTLVNEDPLTNGDFRDPKVFWHKESSQWMMAVAGGPLRFYSSKDLIHWNPEAMQDDIITECP